MNISYNWLKDLIEIDLAPELLAEKLTRVGLAVEGVHPHGDDYIFDIDLTSNRPDCLSHLGVAREIGAITETALSTETRPHGVEDEVPFPSVLAGEVVRIEDPDLCHRFTARIIRNVKIGPSPEWLVKRLEAIGERAINNVADITNYVMHELGQPMHSFDLDKLAENRIVVRRAKAGETIKTLDEVERKLDESMLAICDAEKPAAVAGVMGGFDSGITEETADVLLEVAYFKRESIRHTSRKLNLATEASYRFERGVDINNLKRASDRAMQLICELAGGEACEFIDIYPARFTPAQIESQDISYAVKRLTGLDVETVECLRILNALGIERVSGFQISDLESEIADSEPTVPNLNTQIFISPSWRHDIAIEEDLVEEVARHVGYENIADELPPAYGAGEYQPNEEREKLLRRTLTDNGFDEALSYSFIDTRFDDTFELVPGILDENASEKFVTLQDSVIEGAVRMRPTLLPGLLDAVRLNFNYQRRDVKLFEVGKAFAAKDGEDSLPTERELFALVLTGGELNEHRAMPVREVDFYDAKGAVEAALEAVGFPSAEFRAADVKHLRRGRAAEVLLDGRGVGYLGQINEEIAGNYKFRQPVYAAEIDLHAVLSEPIPAVHYRPLPKYPAVVRDVSFAIDRALSFGHIRKAVEEQGAELCRGVEFVDVYEGKGMDEGQRSLTIRIEYRSDERTLTEEDVNAAHQRILDSLETTLGIKTRI
jgi:phenylalanyl-tRNA synthetase beta chain